jgi:predicted nucleotidyltransferase
MCRKKGASLVYHFGMDPRHAQTDAVQAFCSANRVRRLSLFGSVLHGEAGPESDFDLLVEFEPDVRVGLIRLAELELELSRLFGATVDLRTARDLSHRFRPDVLAEAEVLYAAA